MSSNWRTKVLTPNYKSSYYSSPSDTKELRESYGSPIKERLLTSSGYDNVARYPYTHEKTTTYERVDKYKPPRNKPNSSSGSKLSNGKKSSSIMGEKNIYSPATASSVVNIDSFKNRPVSPTITAASSPGFASPAPKTKKADSLVKKTLVLDLDETLIHASSVPIPKPDFIVKLSNTSKFYVLRRPGLDVFLNSMAKLYELIIYTSSEKGYATKIVNKIDPNHHIKKILHRDHCSRSHYGLDKDLLLIGKDLKGVIFIDNLDENFRLQRDNGLKITDFYSNQRDEELLNLIPFLEHMTQVSDVRPIKRFHSEFLTKNLHTNTQNQNQSTKTRPMTAFQRNGVVDTGNMSERRYQRRSDALDYLYKKGSGKTDSKLQKSSQRLETLKKVSFGFEGSSEKMDKVRSSSYLNGSNYRKLEEGVLSINKSTVEDTSLTNSSTFNAGTYDIERSLANRDKEANKSVYEGEMNQRISGVFRGGLGFTDKKYQDNASHELRESYSYNRALYSDTKGKETSAFDISRRNPSHHELITQFNYSLKKDFKSRYSQEETTSSNFNVNGCSENDVAWEHKDIEETKESILANSHKKALLLEDLHERIVALEKKFKDSNLKTLNF